MRTPKPLFTVIASTIAAIRNCEQSGNVEWLARHRETLCEFRSFLPHGSGFDTGFTIDDSESNENRLVLEFDFHHMDEHGFYVGWTSHKVIVTPSLVSGFDFEIETDDEQKTGELGDYVELAQDYWEDTIQHHLSQKVWQQPVEFGGDWLSEWFHDIPE